MDSIDRTWWSVKLICNCELQTVLLFKKINKKQLISHTFIMLNKTALCEDFFWSKLTPVTLTWPTVSVLSHLKELSSFLTSASSPCAWQDEWKLFGFSLWWLTKCFEPNERSASQQCQFSPLPQSQCTLCSQHRYPLRPYHSHPSRYVLCDTKFQS